MKFRTHNFKSLLAVIAVVSCTACFVGSTLALEKSIVIASTTEPKDTGLFHHLLPLFKEKTSIGVKVLALGSGIALDAARMGEADVVFTHYKLSEVAFVAEGHGVKRYPVMYNDFVLIGP